ncbi:28S ribosomal protein S29, mitochondrial [Ischnura elegans]|uniref:28S ribosomal protein S29, mitochondrial n=1 Tax=Ischnura elegans TaxID=197161 RepID=UPI001ED8A325|nr:28S ribosomal protein S29, mitochondrial [Ischnura elegans]
MAIGMRCRMLSAYVSTLNRLMSSTVVEPSVAVNHMSANSDNSSRIFRTNESNPAKHGENHLGLFYTVPPDVKQLLFQHGGLPKSFEKQVKTFGETCIMVRPPALEIMEYMKAADYSGPAIRYVLFGKAGCGKTLSLCHILHFGLVSGFLLVHVPWVPNWFRRCKESSNSTTRDGFIDLPLDAAAWLIHFKSQNAPLLQKLNLTINNEYVWSKREVTNKGAPLTELIDLGINRIKYASEIIVAVIREIKELSTSGKCKTLVALDGFNAFFSTKTRIKSDDKSMVLPSKVTLTEAFLEITKFDWCNGGVVLTVDQLAACDDRTGSDFPIYQLGQEGFEHLDPFVPVQIEEYNHREVNSCIDYYIDRRWLQSPKAGTDEGRKELEFMSGRNPFQLMKICAPL